jgi:hypothetical protein
MPTIEPARLLLVRLAPPRRMQRPTFDYFGPIFRLEDRKLRLCHANPSDSTLITMARTQSRAQSTRGSKEVRLR